MCGILCVCICVRVFHHSGVDYTTPVAVLGPAFMSACLCGVLMLSSVVRERVRMRV